MASLYTERANNIHKTWALFISFLVVVIVIGYVFAQIFNSSAILYIAVIFSLLMNVFGYWYSDRMVLAMVGAREVKREEMPELYRVVENLAITAGLPIPKVYVIREAAPNAFATGRNPEHAVVAVTEGLLNILDRSELEGVIAHELGHVGNRDMLLSTAVVVLVGFVSILADMFMRSFMWGGFRDRDNNRGGTIMIIVAIAFSILAPIGAMLIQLSISRKREFLADASGALLTRYPEGLIRALRKIEGAATPMRVANNATAHLWISDPFSKKDKRVAWYHKIFMTHPPIEDRIKALEGMRI